MIFKHWSVTQVRAWFAAPSAPGAFARQLAVLLLAALVLRIGLAIPALSEPSSLFRPDSPGYWEPARALAAGDGLVSAPGSEVPESVRPAGYLVWLALGMKLGGESVLFAALAGMVLNVSGIVPLVLAVRKFGGMRASLFAGWLYACNPTAIADSALILSDNLLGVVACWQLWAAVSFMRGGKLRDFAWLSVFAMVGSYVKPVNLPIVFIGLPVLALAGSHSLKKFGQCVGTAAVLAAVLLVPYLMRNIRLSGDPDGNTANSYFHNGSAILAYATGESSELWRRRLLARAEKEFAANPGLYPSLKEQNAWKKSQFAALIRQYPQAAVITHLPQPGNLLPDAPTLLENNRVTASGQGTMAVLRQRGLVAATNHYLGGKWWILLPLLPLLAVTAVTYLAAGWQVYEELRRWQWRWLLVFGTLVFYYLWAPGPVISPRYALPALPLLIALAAWKFEKKGSLEP